VELQPHDHPKAVFDGLASQESVRVTLHLRGNTSLTGTIGPTGNHAVIIKALSGKDFFDAYVRYDAITCIEVQTRS
jgi:hypothetical protein